MSVDLTHESTFFNYILHSMKDVLLSRSMPSGKSLSFCVYVCVSGDGCDGVAPHNSSASSSPVESYYTYRLISCSAKRSGSSFGERGKDVEELKLVEDSVKSHYTQELHIPCCCISRFW